MNGRTIQQRINQIERVRNRLVRNLNAHTLTPEQLSRLRWLWNLWCRGSLNVKNQLQNPAHIAAWSSSTEVRLRDALRHNLAGFQFPGEVKLDPPNGVDICFAKNSGWRTVFYGAVLCENVKCDSKFYATNCTFRDRLWVAWTTFHGPVSFTGSEFLAEVTFKGCNFMGPAAFLGATFRKNAEFSSCIFANMAAFEFAKAQERVRFQDIIYKSTANFKQIKLLDGGRNVVSFLFSNCSFENLARFDFVEIPTSGTLHFINSNFDGILSFWGARILGSLAIERSTCGDALFLATQSNLPEEAQFHASGSVSLRHTHTKRLVMEGAKFDRVPDFVGMHVDGPVELDLVEIGEEPPEDVRKLPPREQAAELTARWRALKRLAEQAGHHYYTALFARNETRARELLDREQRPLAALLGRIYGALSDYGLSLWRPWAWWSSAAVVCAVLYWVAYWVSWDHAPFIGCIAGEGSTVGAALWRSLRSAFVFGGAFTAADFDWARACLFGASEPWFVTLLGLAQSVFSAVLLFLFLLAVRNHFRIR